MDYPIHAEKALLCFYQTLTRLSQGKPERRAMLRQFKRHLKESARRTAWPTAMGLVALLLFSAAGATHILRDQESRSVDEQGNIYQSGRSVGWAVGARISRKEAAAVEFEEILNAAKLAHGAEFQYGGYVLKIFQIRQVEYVPSGHAKLETKLLKVVAKIQ
jgi:hypothetical protein